MGERGRVPILAAAGVGRSYPARHGVRPRARRREPRAVARRDPRGRRQVGAGKSTLARLLLGLESPDEGAVSYAGRALASLGVRDARRMRRAVQAVFQDPTASLDPRQSVGTIVAEALVVHNLAPRAGRRERSRELLAEVGLPGEDAFLERLPRELSGGERQRVAIARALASGPEALILDEPVSALDVSVRGQVLNLLLELQRRTGMAMLVIAHDVLLVAATVHEGGGALGRQGRRGRPGRRGS